MRKVFCLFITFCQVCLHFRLVFIIGKFCFLMCKDSVTCPTEGNGFAAANDIKRVQCLPKIVEQGTS